MRPLSFSGQTGGAAKIETDAIVLGKIIDSHGRAAALQIGGSRHDLAPGRAELARHHAGIGQGADAESHIGAVEIKVDQFVRQERSMTIFG